MLFQKRAPIRFAFLSSLLFILAGCSLAPAVPPSPSLESAPALGTMKRRLTFTPDDTSRDPSELIGLIRLDESDLRVVLLTPYGQRLVTLVSDDQGSHYEAGDVPKEHMRDALPVPAEWLASRLQWSLWPVEALRDAFSGTAWTVSIDENTRVIRQDGRIIARISPATTAKDRDDTVLLNDRQGGYRLRISPLESSPQ